MKVIILGAQGSGKGTQAKLLSESFKIPHISTGDILREEYDNKTELGLLANEYTKKGLLIPNELVNDIVKRRLERKDCKIGFILDGYPRNIEQANFLSKIIEIDKVIYLKVSEDIVFKRLAERMICSKCNQIYGINKKPKKDEVCDECGSKLVKRQDDKEEEQIRTRLRGYEEKTLPLLEFYKEKLIEIDGSGKPIEIFKEIMKKL
ncbi:adenylate kinase [Candidatus Woesearchaeota archaeon]|nr:adenylate kinase [Candidatus Woesearchaeota archaeon]